MPFEHLGDLVKKAIEEALRERGVMNIIIAGRTGVGKTTLINSVFQGNMGETGQGRPVTQNTREITKEGVPLRIWDTRGLELAAFKDALSELETLVERRNKDRDPTQHIHVAWLCVQEDGRRVEDAEIALHETLARHMPILGIITKARADQGFRVEVQRLLPHVRNVVRVRAIADILDDGHVIPPMGLDELIMLTGEVIPEAHRRALAAAQKVSLDYKVSNAHKVVVGATAAAVAAGASPIPFSDVVVLVPIQVGMLAGITAAFGLELSKAFLATIVSSAAGTLGATFAGRALVSNLLKLIPGAGTLAGVTISAATAGTLTAAVGEIYIATLRTIMRQSVDGFTPEEVAAEFRRRMEERKAGRKGTEESPA